jgi:hypothetical protein
LQRLHAPEVGAQLVAQDGRIDLVLARQLAGVHRLQFGQQLVAEVDRALAAGRAEIVDFAGASGGGALQAASATVSRAMAGNEVRMAGFRS